MYNMYIFICDVMVLMELELLNLFWNDDVKLQTLETKEYDTPFKIGGWVVLCFVY